ncbi:trichohyalin-like [Carassius carassius]|uniref:trichohyalin-like n=1 Tax=Carassius carassius TaxID=217509 RepID=UPI002868DCE5|nr:trichohyalin-like [Carassius carassius]
MAAWVEATTREMGQSLINPDKPSVSASALPGDTGKPALRPKPHLMPKPFALQRNATVRPIRAYSRELHRAASSEALLDTKKPGAGGPNLSEYQKPGSNGTVNGSNKIAAPKSIPLSPKPDLLAKPKPEPTKSPGSNNQTGPNSKPAVTAEDLKNVQPRSRAKSLGSQDKKILTQKDRGEAAKTEADVKVSSRCWPPRNRLSVELTSKFESMSQPEKEVRRDAETSKTEKEWPPHSPSESKPSKLPVDTGEMGDEDVSGGSIKRRISLLFDRSTATQCRDTFNKRDNPAAEISVDIKQRIQNLSLDAPRTRLPSTGAPKSPPFVKKLSTSDETPNERSSEKPTATEKVPVNTAEIKNSAASVERVEEEEDHEDEEEDCVPVPVYQRVGMSLDVETKRREEEEKQSKDEQLEKERQQRVRLLEKERKARETERQEERKQEEEKQRQMDERRKQEEERKRRIEEERKEEEKRRQAEKEKERQIEEKRRIEEEKERLREEERIMKEREKEEERRRIQELERKREEERLRQEREKEERLKKQREMEERKHMEQERLKEEERLRQEREREKLKKEKEMEEERRRIQELERQKEEERWRKERELERLHKEREIEEKKRMEEERQREEERLRQERERERLKKEKEMEEERRRIQELERQREEERLRKEQELERIRREKEMEEERRRIQELERQKEEERLRKERELDRIRREKEMEEERRRIQELERQKEEQRLRKEQELERMRKEKEIEEERKRIQELARQKEEERLRKEQELERMRKEKEIEEERKRIQELARQKEEERLRKEQELDRIRKEKEMEERRRTQEIERQKEEERLRKERELERIRKEKEMEEERQRIQRQKEEERLRQEREIERLKKEKEIEEERRRTQEFERQKEEEKRRQVREHEMKMETCEAAERLREEVPTSYDLISFDVEESAASQTLVSSVQLADVLPRLAQVTYDDFSVKPRRWGTRARRSSTPSPSRETPAAPDHSLQQEIKSSHPGPQEPSGDRVSVHDLIGFEPEASSPLNSTEIRTHTYLFEAESKPGDLLEPETDEGQLKDGGVEEQDTENLIWETDEQTENHDTADDPATQIRINQALQRLTQARRRNTSSDSDTADVPVHEELQPLPLLESVAPLLDSSVFRSKVELGKKRSIKRTRPSRAVRQRSALPALTEGTQPDWRFCDSTEAKDQCSNGADSESEEEPSRDVTCSPAPSQPKRVPVFPGMDPSALMAQLKRRSAAIETESPTEAQTPPSVPSRSPRTPNMALGPRVLPPVDAKDSGSGSSPSWLLELKSKKRMSQPESEA